MPRPKSILWVDDEVESLTSHVLFLEEQGFAVETTTHGDDALVLLQRQPYGVVLLDEQMPGRRGLELFRAIRAIDNGMPVVMVTKSEETETLKDAIGSDISDYLIKPVNPRQILSVVTRLLDGDRIRQQRLSRDFATRFRELEARRAGPLAWREWVELVAELAEWEVRLGQADEPGLQDALRTLQESLRQDFARYLQRNYASWLHDGDSDRPPLSVDIGAEFLRPVLDMHRKALLVVVDCLRLDQWAMIRPLINARFDIETAHYFSILPTATPFARNAIFSGLFPAEIKARYPQWWSDSEESSLNAHEAELLTEQLKELTGRHIPVHYEKVFTAADGEGLLKRLPAHLAQDGVTALVFNFIDQLTHGRTENSTLYEVARDTPALRNLTRTWFERSPLWDALREAERRGVPVLLTTDHGSIHCHTPATVFAKRDTTSNLRYKFGDDLRAQDADAAIVVDDLPSFGLPARGPGTRLLLATGDRFFVYPTKLREYQARYRGAFLHGGVSPEEVILPIALLTPRHG
ncbi:MAG: PglZ domain-containing protein [Gemmatimonadales bacterium]|nr:PglZ domain-containing protein [Gemmatimonadales bacterium]